MRSDILERATGGYFFPADVHRFFTAWIEGAAVRQIDDVGRLARME
jgi:hypothetical protein